MEAAYRETKPMSEEDEKRLCAYSNDDEGRSENHKRSLQRGVSQVL